jgi:hypothetical protein
MVESTYSTVPDPLNDRTCSEKDCPRLINKPLEDSVLFSKEGGNPDWKLLKDFLSREGPIPKP